MSPADSAAWSWFRPFIASGVWDRTQLERIEKRNKPLPQVGGGICLASWHCQEAKCCNREPEVCTHRVPLRRALRCKVEPLLHHLLRRTWLTGISFPHLGVSTLETEIQGQTGRFPGAKALQVYQQRMPCLFYDYSDSTVSFSPTALVTATRVERRGFPRTDRAR